jgi:PAS domain S-box-containing protein
MNEPGGQNSELQTEISELEHYIGDLWTFFPTPLAYINPLGIIMDADQALLDLLGQAKDELIGHSLYTLSPKPEELKKMIAATLAQGSVSNRGLSLIGQTGKMHQVSLSTMARKDRDNNLFGIFVSIIDLSGTRKTEEALKARAEELEKINKFLVGRELDMIELKKEVNGLLSELGRAAKYKTS